MELEAEVLLACKGAIAHIDEVVSDFNRYEQKVKNSRTIKNPKDSSLVDRITKCHSKIEEGIGLLDIYKLLIEDITNPSNRNQNLQEIISEFDIGLNSTNRGFHSYLSGLGEFHKTTPDPYVEQFSAKIKNVHTMLMGLSTFLKTRYSDKKTFPKTDKPAISIGVYVADQKLFRYIKNAAQSFLEKVRPGLEIQYEELTDFDSITKYMALHPSKNIFFIYGLKIIGKDTQTPTYIPMPEGRDLLKQFEIEYKQQIADKSVHRLIFRPYTEEKSVGLAYNSVLAGTMGTKHLMKEHILTIKDDQMSHSFNRYLLRIISEAYVNRPNQRLNE